MFIQKQNTVKITDRIARMRYYPVISIQLNICIIINYVLYNNAICKYYVFILTKYIKY